MAIESMNGSVRYIVERLSQAYDRDEALALAYWVIEERTGLSRSELLLHTEMLEIPDLDDIIERLMAYEPVQYVFGHTLWAGLDLRVNEATLIPRPETAELLTLLPQSERPMRVLDIGTGSGCIAIAIKRAHPTWRVTATDVSEAALCVARENAARNGVEVQFEQQDILTAPIAAPWYRYNYDIVISNPPYIRQMERNTMSENVLRHEPEGALFVPDEDPLLFYRAIAQLELAKTLYFEINEHLGVETAEMLRQNGYPNVKIIPDSYGKDRFIIARVY